MPIVAVTRNGRVSHPPPCFLKHCCNYLTSTARRSRRQASTSSVPGIPQEATNVAVLGGGITGLTTAYYLSKRLPNARITLFEASSRLGGWLRSAFVDIGNGKVVFEQGPRNLRPSIPNGLITLQLIQELGLEGRLLVTSKESPAAQNRFIYYPDHLVRMPGPGRSLWSNVSNLLSEPIFKGTISGTLSEVTKPRRPANATDQSVGSFLTRRVGPTLTDNVASAVFHGVYAGDIYKLSARTILSKQWQLEGRHASILAGLLQGMLGGEMPILTADLQVMKEMMQQPKTSEDLENVKSSSVYTLKGGLGELADRLEKVLEQSPNTSINRNTEATRIKAGVPELSDSDLELHFTNTDGDACRIFSHVISTIAGERLARITDPHYRDNRILETNNDTGLTLSLGQLSAVTVMVVNLFFSDPDILPVHGFGYLLPRSIPFEQNPERALGVVFDSDASIGQDDVPGTKITVMLGGHWWDDFDSYPDEEEGAAMAKAILQRHLCIRTEPQAVRVSLQRDCIPQYEVGHDMRMETAHNQLARWRGKLRVAGNSFTGVGLNDCVRAARDVVKGLAEGTGTTGLDDFAGGRAWSWVR